jgi:dephospho-CoA kinase
MKVIGLTGGIGSGKSEVLSLLQAKGAAVIDADEVAHRAYRAGTDIWHKVVGLFGRAILDDRKEIDRGKLGNLAFGDPSALQRLNDAVHPLVRARVSDQLDELRKQGQAVAVVEVPLLFEAGWQNLMDDMWVVWVPPEVAAQRIKAQRGLTGTEVRERIEAQTSNEWKIQQADVAIENTGSLNDLYRAVEVLWNDRIGNKGWKQ